MERQRTWPEREWTCRGSWQERSRRRCPRRGANFCWSYNGVGEEIITHSAEETTRWGREFAKRLTPPVLVLLTGDLGSGKTTLTKGIVAGLGAASEDEVTSPTFTLVHVYGGEAKVYHGDLYRIENFRDFESLGLEDAFATPAVMILEWSEKFPLESPWPEVRLRLEHLGADSRRISVL